MPFPYDKYPWLNFQELNLAYFIKHFREIFEQWDTLLNEMHAWKDQTDADLDAWKAAVVTGISSWETGFQQSMEEWKNETEADITAWEATTLAALNAWKTATTAVFEQIRTEAAASATAAAGSATSAQTAMTAAQTAQAAAEAAAAEIQSELAQIQTNSGDIAELQAQLILLTDEEEAATVTQTIITKDVNGVTVNADSESTLSLYGQPSIARHYMFLNGQDDTRTSSSAFNKTLDAGVYDINFSATGFTQDVQINYTETVFSAAARKPLTNGIVTFENDVMIGIWMPTTANFGTSANPTVLSFSAKKLVPNDTIAREDIEHVASEISALSAYNAVHSPSYQNGFAGILKGFPSFTFNSGNSITVTIPQTGHGRTIYSGNLVTDAQGATERTFTVLRNNYLVYDTVVRDFAIRANTAAVLNTDVVCFLCTSSGNMVGNWISFLAYQNGNSAKEIANDASNTLNSEISNELNLIPDYYNANDYFANKIDAIKTIGFGLSVNSLRFIFITDYHLKRNTGHSLALSKEIMRECGIRELYFNGDYQDKEATPYAGYKVLCDFLDAAKPIEYGNHVYYTTGNHEFNNPSGQEPTLEIERDPIFQLFNACNKNIININPAVTNAYYVDYPDIKLRVYGIDCNYESEITPGTRKFVFDSLLTVPEGYSVFITSHVGKGAASSATLSSRFAQIMQACAAMNDGTSVSFNLGSPYGTVTYDFAGHVRDFIGAITGHTHVDDYIIYDNRFPVIITECDTLTESLPNRVAGTITEQCFDVVQLDITNRRIYCTRIGDGSDRTFSFGENAGLIT